MKTFLRNLFALTAVLSTAALPAAPQDALTRLDQDLKSAAAFEYGKDSAPLRRIEQVVIESATNQAQRVAVEERLLTALRSATTRDTKEFLCRQLFTIGTATAVPELEKLLSSPEFSHLARYALGRIEDPAAGAALRRALRPTSGKIQAGIINTLAARREAAALREIIPLIASADAEVAQAAIAAVGRFGGAEAVKALEARRAAASDELRLRVDDALMICADDFLARQQRSEAGRLYEQLFAADRPKHVRIGALRGLLSARESQAATLLAEAFRNPDAALRAAAVGFARSIPGAALTGSFVQLLPSLTPDTQALLLRALASRGDPTAEPAALAALKSEDAAVRLAAVEALGSLGNSATAGLLARRAAATTGPEQQAARSSLLRLHGEEVDAALIRELGTADAKARAEVIRALAGRRARAANGELLRLARADTEAAVRREAIRALGKMAGAEDLRALLALLVMPQDPSDRGALAEAASETFQRIPDNEVKAGSALAVISDGAPEAKAALLRLLSAAPTPRTLEAVRAATRDPSSIVSDAAIRALCEWPAMAAAEDLLSLARTAGSETHRALALRAYVRLAGLSQAPTPFYLRAMQLAQSPADKKLVLAGLATAQSPEALELVRAYLKDPPFEAEAALAAVQLAKALQRSEPTRSKEALKEVLAAVKADRVRKQAQEVLNELEQHEGYILTWQMAGPFREKNKESRALFDTALAPEIAGATNIIWKPLTRGLGQWDINLDAALGSDSHVAGYLRTRVWSPQLQDAQLELGSDDAVKAWLNRQQVHASYQNRGLAPRQDLAKVKLQQGWNDLLLKVVNHEGGWAACCRLRKPDGSALDGLRFEAK